MYECGKMRGADTAPQPSEETLAGLCHQNLELARTMCELGDRIAVNLYGGEKHDFDDVASGKDCFLSELASTCATLRIAAELLDAVLGRMT